MKSEFGKGYFYCLSLFLAHADKANEYQILEQNNGSAWKLAMTWFNGSSAHLYELQIPDNLSKELNERVSNLRSKCLKWGRGFPTDGATWVDVDWAIQEAKDLIRLSENELLKTESVKGDWE